MRTNRFSRLTSTMSGVALVGISVALAWRGLVTLPHAYDALAARGIPERVQIERCGVGDGNDSRQVGCVLRSSYAGHVKDRSFDEDLRPRAAADGTVGAVVDPQDPNRWALPDELAHRIGAGWHGSRIAGAGMLLAFGIVLLVANRVLSSRARRRSASAT